jgi:hypothetical protein
MKELEQASLLPVEPEAAAVSHTSRTDLHQWFTPQWACEAIIERHFPELSAGDSVLEPSCGPGRFLMALPAEVDALGVEIDPTLAERARRMSGRTVITGDFLQLPLDRRFTHAVGNPPFEAGTIHRFLNRTHDLLEDGGKCGMLLPAYIFQTSTKVLSLAERWSISQELVPRNIFPGLSLPLVFAMFRKERVRSLVGFFLYREAADVATLPRPLKAALQEAPTGSVWRHAVRSAFEYMGVQAATLEALYAAVERPTANKFWREQVRKTLGAFPEFRREAAGVWSLQPEAA